MSSSDVRSILDLPQASSSNNIPTRKLAALKRPDGISRELYALIGDNAPSLADVQASISAVKYRDRPKPKGLKSRWDRVDFTPAARVDNPVRLKHWIRVTDDNPVASVEHFGRFNQHGPSVMEYSQFEYDQHLADPYWTVQETGYLFSLLREYDLRFVVAADRYRFEGSEGIMRRSVEEMKDRYYTICRRLTRTRTPSDTLSQQQQILSYSFDKEREIKRKQYASELFHLTAAEIFEEESLYVEIKRLEQNERRYRAERDDLLRTVVGLDSGLIHLDQDSIDAVLGVNKKRKRPEDEILAPAPPKENAAFDTSRCILRLPLATPSNGSHLAAKHPMHLPVYLRSTKLPVPRLNASVRISELVNEIGISTQKLVMPTRSNLEEFDALLIATGALVDMKRQVERVGQELRMLRAQRDGYVPPIEQRKVNYIADGNADLKARSESVTSTDTSMTGRRSRQI